MIAILAVSAVGCTVLSIRKPSTPPWPAVPVKTIQVVPMGWLDQEPIPAGEGVRIAAGAMESPAHQARVLIETEAGEAGVRVPIQVVGGKGRSPGGDARLTMDGVTAFGGGPSILVTTGEKGRISGILTSSECLGFCSIVAGTMDTMLRFSSFDLCGGETDWGDLPPGVYTNTLVFRHSLCSRSGCPDDHMLPLTNHEIHVFAEKLVWLDTNGVESVALNIPTNPADLSAWVVFPTNGIYTDAEGKLSYSFAITPACARVKLLHSEVYDYSVWTEGGDPFSSFPAHYSRKLQASASTPTNLEERLRQIVVPWVDCEQLAVPKAIAYLEAACEKYETPGPGRKGRIRIVLEGGVQMPETENTVTFVAQYISAWDCAKIIADISGRRCFVRDRRTLVIAPRGDEPSGAQGADENDAMELDPFRVDEI
jgi:hypothetical protein